MTEHTPGPWVAIEPDSDESYSVDVWEVHDGFGRTATVWGEDEPAGANARLIASAPDLLEALERLLSLNATQGVTDEDYEAATAAADAAIARARG